MRLRRLLASLTATLVAGPALAIVATAAPADAATPTHIVGSDGSAWMSGPSSSSQPGAIVWGDSLRVSINVVTDSGEQVFDGTLALQRKLAGQSSWSTVKSSSSAYMYETLSAQGNASYRVVYSGSAEYSPSSSTVGVKVQRKLDIKNVGSRKVVLKGKVSPKFSGKLTVYKLQGKKWKKFKTLRAKKSRFSVPLPAPRSGRYYWNIKIPGSSAFALSQTGKFYTYSI